MAANAPEQKASQEVKWVYALSVPHAEGEPNIEIVIGVPQDHKTTGWLLPGGFEKKNLNYHIEVPLNVVVGDQRIECIAIGTVRGDFGGNKFGLEGIEAKQDLPQGAAEAIEKTYQRILDPEKSKTVWDALSQEIEEQCKKYFKRERTEE